MDLGGSDTGTRKCQMAREIILSRGKSPPATEIGARQKSVRDTD